MEPPLAPTPPAHDPGPRVRSLVALILRTGLGLQLLNSGLTGFLYVNMGRNLRPGMGGAFERFGISPGSEEMFRAVPYVQIVIGLALLLGFMTTLAATLAALLVEFPAIAQTLM